MYYWEKVFLYNYMSPSKLTVKNLSQLNSAVIQNQLKFCRVPEGITHVPEEKPLETDEILCSPKQGFNYIFFGSGESNLQQGNNVWNTINITVNYVLKVHRGNLGEFRWILNYFLFEPLTWHLSSLLLLVDKFWYVFILDG